MVVYFLMVMLAFPGLIQHSVSAQSVKISDVRLNGGSSRNTGTLQLLIPVGTGGWQTHCGTRNSIFASVVCRMLGYNTNGISYSGGTRLTGNYLRHYFICNGDEATIADCRSNGYSRSSYCYPTLITCPTCQSGTVRLIGGLIPQQGNVEVCLSGTWSRVCNRNWDYKDSFVVCRQLGYPATQAVSASKTQNSHIGFVPSTNAYNCIGNESSLLNCNHVSDQSCQLDNSVGLYRQINIFCRGNLAGNNQCSPGAIRLSGGRDQFEGRMEVCSNNRMWGTVSRSGWDSNDATVACRQLGLLQTNGIVTRVTLPTFGPGVGPILIYDVRCTGSERRLVDCPSGSYHYGTGHYIDAGVRCQINPSPVHTCTFGEVRLVGGNSSSEGRVEMCYRGVWGSICTHGWNNIDAAVVCRQLGFQGENSTAITSQVYGEGSGPYLLSSVGCRGHERSLTECSYLNSQIGYHTCSSGQDAGVRCDVTMCEHGDVRLYGGYSRAGAAEVCINGLWANICYQDWDETDSRVFCKQLLGKENITTLYSSCCNRISPTTNTTLINVACSNRVNSSFVRDCSYGLVQRYATSSCFSSSSVIVGCYDIENCVNGSIRLTGGSRRSEGVVEICLDRVWGTITNDRFFFNPMFAEVVCRQLGFPEWSHYEVPVTQRKSPHILSNVLCNGNEDTLLNCSYYRRLSLSQSSGNNDLNYNSYSAVGVTCDSSQGSVFHVTVTSNATGPVQLGSVIELHCSISPDPSIDRPVQLEYRWRGNNGGWSRTTSSPNVTLNVHVAHYETSYYFCSVHINDRISAAGSGSTIVKIKDLLIPVLKVSPIESEEQNNLTLGVNITSDSAKYIMRNLNWYFNGNSIGNSSNTIISNGNKTLTTTNGIAGEYEVRYDGLLLNNPYDSTCEKMILKTLRHHPLFKPVKFLISTKEVMNRKPEIDIQFNGGIDTFTSGDNFTLKAVGQLATSIEQSEVDIVWYFNGNSVGSSSRVRNRNSISRDLRRTSATYLHDGIYEALLVWNMNQECSSYYRQLSHNRVILAKTSIEVKYYDSLNHSFSADKNELFSSEVALLRCSATIRYPPLSSISIVKNNITLQTTTGSTLSVRTGAFGLYQCRVNATGVIFLLEVMIKEKARLRIQFQVRGPLECREDTVFMGTVKSSVVAKLREDCSCNISVNNLQNSSLQCNNAQTVTFSTLVVFSSDSGDETASTLTNRLSSQVSASAVSLNLNGSEVLITSAHIGDSSESNVGIYVGLFFGGVLSCAFLAALLVMIMFLMYRMKSSKKPPKDANATKGEARYSNRTGECHIEERPKVHKKPIVPAMTNPGAMQPNESYAIMSVQQEADTVIYECVN